MSARKSEFVTVPAHQLAYLKVICRAASRAAAKAQQASLSARAELADTVAVGARPAQLHHVLQLHRDAIQKMNIVLFLGQLYVAAFRRHSPQGPLLAQDDR